MGIDGEESLWGLKTMEDALSLSLKDIPHKNWKFFCVWTFWSDVTTQTYLNQLKSLGGLSAPMYNYVSPQLNTDAN